MLRKKSILIVDDSEFYRSLIKSALLSKERVTLLEAQSGAECMNIIKNTHIDLILMDIVMPDISGKKAVEMIRQDFTALQLPIIMITASSDDSDIITSLQLGANDYISKPVNFDIAISRIKTHLTLAETSKKVAQIQEMSAINSMIATYNHEINNPLSVAISYMEKIEKDPNDLQAHEKLKESLWKISDIIKKIRDITENSNVQYTPYGSAKMVKLK